MRNPLCSLFLGLGLALSSASAADQPNILFIFADDHCYKAINSLHNKEVETPHLDRLVEQGTTFTHAYNMGSWSGAVCLASRAMLNTGRFIWNAQESTGDKNKIQALVDNGQTWGQLMSKAGYETYFTGKWHVKAAAEDLFQNVRNVRPGMPKQTPTGYNRPLADGSDPWDPADPKFGGFWEGGTHWSEVLAEDSEAFLTQASKSEKPFFMYLAFNAPHDPRQAPQEYLDKYPADKVAVPPGFVGENPYGESMGSGRKLRDERLAPYPRTEHAVQVNRREYYALITHMDTQIGRILEALEKTGKADNTYIFFSADHGRSVGHHGLLGKQNFYDHSIRVPFVIKGPGIEEGKQIEEPIYLQDVMATSLDYAGAERPDYVEFQSLRPILKGGKSAYDSIYFGYLGKQRAIVRGGYKLVLLPTHPEVLLFDMNKDPEEEKNLAENPEQLPRMKALFAELKTLQKGMNDDLDLDEVFPQLK